MSAPPPASAADLPTAALREQDGTLVITLAGAWIVAHIADGVEALRRLDVPRRPAVTIDVSGVTRLDTSGALIASRMQRVFTAEGSRLEWAGVRPEHRALVERVIAVDTTDAYSPPKAGFGLVELLAVLGEGVIQVFREIRQILDFWGRTVGALATAVLHPRRLRATAFVHHLEAAGIRALPIASLLCFLIGIVVAYIGADMMRAFGAGNLTVLLLGYVVLRELGVLLVAILVAGRSGSAFTAQIGSMKGRDEIDAMRTIGLDPFEVLVVPRVLALVVAVPALVFVGNIMGLIGGAVGCWTVLDMTNGQFWAQLRLLVGVEHFWVGIGKAPVFALLIGLIGCYEGFQVEGSAESVGQRTTRSVVLSIFAVIVADAIFAILFVRLGI